MIWITSCLINAVGMKRCRARRHLPEGHHWGLAGRPHERLMRPGEGSHALSVGWLQERRVALGPAQGKAGNDDRDGPEKQHS
jgi:hypothetical protein